MNVNYHLNQLGVPAALISRVGNDTWGKGLIDLLQQRQVSTAFIQMDESHPTGLVTASVHPNHEVTYEIHESAAWDFIQFDADSDRLLQQARYLVFGSLAARNENSRKTLFALLEQPVTRVFDINLRPPHFDRPVVEALLQKTEALKLNENELPLVSAWYGSYRDKKDQMQLLQDRFGINTILVTCGGEGALLLLDGRLYAHGGYQVKVKDTVGSGDAFLAAYLYQTLNNEAPEQRLVFANRLGAFVATQEGACPSYHIHQTEIIQ